MGEHTHRPHTGRTRPWAPTRIVPPLIAILSLVGVSLGGTAVAEHDGYRAYTGPATVSLVDGNQTCLTLEDDALGELKIDPFDGSSAGVHTSADGQLEIELSSLEFGEQGAFFDFEVTADSTADVSSVFVKQAGGGLFYDYGESPVPADTDLHPQVNEATGEVFDSISHVSFCYQPEAGPVGPPAEAEYRVEVNPDHDWNQVGTDHTFRVLIESRTDGGAWQPVEGAVVDADDYGYARTGKDTSLDPAALVVVDDDDCEQGTDADGVCEIVVTSSDAGSSKLTVRGATIGERTVEFSGPVSDIVSFKHWIDYDVTVDADSTNLLGQAHSFTVTALRDDGFGDPEPLPGATLHFTWTGPVGNTIDWTGDGAGGGSVAATCVTDGDGRCTFTVDSDERPGTGTLEITRLVAPEGDVSDGGSVTFTDRAMDKTWVAYEVVITPPDALNPVGEDHRFDLHVVAYDGDGTAGLPAGLADHLAGGAADAELVTGDEHLALTPVWDGGVGAVGAHDCAGMAEGHCTVTVASGEPGSGTLSVAEVVADHDGDGTAGPVAGADQAVAATFTGDSATKTWEVVDDDTGGDTGTGGAGDTDDTGGGAVLPQPPVTRSGDTGPHEPEPTTTVQPAAERDDDAGRGGALPRTGTDTLHLLALAALLLGAGGGALWAGGSRVRVHRGRR